MARDPSPTAARAMLDGGRTASTEVDPATGNTTLHIEDPRTGAPIGQVVEDRDRNVVGRVIDDGSGPRYVESRTEKDGGVFELRQTWRDGTQDVMHVFADRSRVEEHRESDGTWRTSEYDRTGQLVVDYGDQGVGEFKDTFHTDPDGTRHVHETGTQGVETDWTLRNAGTATADRHIGSGHERHEEYGAGDAFPRLTVDRDVGTDGRVLDFHRVDRVGDREFHETWNERHGEHHRYELDDQGQRHEVPDFVDKPDLPPAAQRGQSLDDVLDDLDSIVLPKNAATQHDDDPYD